ncbi:MAG TPA: PilZ domain-containing protein [Myxococcota bacterium]
MDPVRQTSEPRRDLPVPLPVEVVGREGAARIEYAVNVSASGLCLHAPRPWAAGQSLRVAFTLPDGGGRIEAHARVAWSEAPARSARARFRELGLRFETLREEDRRRLARFAAGLPAELRPGGDGAR